MLDGTVLVESVWLAGRDEEWFRRGWEAAADAARPMTGLPLLQVDTSDAVDVPDLAHLIRETLLMEDE